LWYYKSNRIVAPEITPIGAIASTRYYLVNTKRVDSFFRKLTILKNKSVDTFGEKNTFLIKKSIDSPKARA